MNNYFDEKIINSILEITEKLEGKSEAEKRKELIKDLEKKIERVDKNNKKIESSTDPNINNFEEEPNFDCCEPEEDCEDCYCFMCEDKNYNCKDQNHSCKDSFHTYGHETLHTPYKVFHSWDEFKKDTSSYNLIKGRLSAKEFENLEQSIKKEEKCQEENVIKDLLKKSETFEKLGSIDLTDRVFGELMVQKRLDINAWECLCSCGKFCIVGLEDLLNREFVGCDDCKKEYYSKPQEEDSMLIVEERMLDILDIPPYYQIIINLDDNFSIENPFMQEIDNFFNFRKAWESKKCYGLNMGSVLTQGNLYALITRECGKNNSLKNLKKALEVLRGNLKTNGCKMFLAFPMIGYGDLDWNIAKETIIEEFSNTDYTILFLHPKK